MNAERTTRLYCPTHKTSFDISPGARPVCEVGGHALAERFPPEDFWEYCCDCQTFRPSEIVATGSAPARCMVCDRQIARRHLCDSCKVISVESDEAAKRRKPYTVAASGAVAPECPACGTRPRAAALSPHDCPEAEARFTTAREVCPFCDKQVKAAPPPEAAAGPPPPGLEEQETAGFCGQCGRAYRAGNTFCGSCGMMLPTHPGYLRPDAPPYGADEPPYGADAPPYGADVPPYEPPRPVTPARLDEGGSSPGKGVIVAVAVIAGALLLVGVVASVSNSNRNSASYNTNYYVAETTDSKLRNAISQNNLVTPSGSSAYDYYQQLRREGAGSSALASHAEKLPALLKEKPQRLLADLYEPGGDDGTLTDWDEAARMLEWAAELSPSDSWVKSRAVYCRGRVAYLNKNTDDALSLWQQAGELDKSWPVPVNGVGLIYNERREYVTARPFFREALRRDPNWAVPYNNLGTSYRESGETADAYENYNRAVSLAPKWGRPHAWLGDMAMKDADYSRATDEYRAVLDLVPAGTPGWNLDRIRQKYDAARAKAGY